MKKIITFILVLCCLCTFAFGCGANEEEKANTFYVMAIKKGYGTDWLDAMLKSFCDKKGMTYKLTTAANDNLIKTTVESGKGYCDYDMVFYSTNNLIDSKFLADITDIVNDYSLESGDRAGKTVSELLGSDLCDALNLNYLFPEKSASYNALPWTSGASSWIVNVKVVEDALGSNWKTQYPCRTTKEFSDFCAALKTRLDVTNESLGKNEKQYVLSYCADSSQLLGAANVWWAQYEGISGMKDFWSGRYFDSELNNYITDTPRIMEQNGLLEALKVIEDLYYDNRYSNEKFGGLNWEYADTYFMMGRAAMKSGGDWTMLENARNFSDTKLEFIKMPIISSLGTKLGITEEQLISIIDYVDAINDNKSAVKPTIFNDKYTVDELISRVAEARSLYHSYIMEHLMSIVNYNKADVAKEFIKYMISDEGNAIYIKNSGGLTLPYGYNAENDDYFSSFTTFAKSKWDLLKSQINYLYPYKNYKYGGTGLSAFPYAIDQKPMETALAKKNATAQSIFEYNKSSIASAWNSITIIANNKYIK